MFALPQPGDTPSSDSVRLADWVEINLLTGEERVVSVTDVADELVRTPPDDSRDSESRSAYQATWGTDDGPMRPGYRDMAEEEADAAFAELSERSGWLEDRYPIEVDGDAALLRQEMAAHEIYSFLVMLRARQLYRGALEDDGSESGLLFEDLVKHALGAYAGASPKHQVRFGLAGGFRGDGLPQRLDQAIEELCQRMFEEPEQTVATDQGDYRADAVAWKPFGDERAGQLVLIGQATITEGDWKRDQPSKKWTDRRLVRFLARPLTAVAFPETLSLTSSDALEGMAFWSVPFDRLRLLSVLSDDDLPSDLRNGMEAWGRKLKARLPQ